MRISCLKSRRFVRLKNRLLWGLTYNVGQITFSDGPRYDLPDTTRLEMRGRRYQG